MQLIDSDSSEASDDDLPVVNLKEKNKEIEDSAEPSERPVKWRKTESKPSDKEKQDRHRQEKSEEVIIIDDSSGKTSQYR